jgi:hypothetical protein
MSVFEGLLKGYLGAKIANTEANDRLKANVLESAGTNILTNVLPQAVEDEKTRKNNYEMLASRYNTNFAEVADASGYTLNDATMKKLTEDLESNNLNEDKLKNAKFETDYNMRYNTRVKTFEDKYNPILKQIGVDEIGGLGFNTVESLVGNKPMKSEDMAKGPVPSDSFSSMQLSDYLTPMSGTYQIPETEFAKVAQPYRGFGGSIQFTAEGGVNFTLPGTKDVEYLALRAVTNDVASQFLDADKKVNISQAVEQADRVLRNQTQDVIAGITNDYKEIASEGVIQSTATDFSQSFNTKYPTDEAKLEALTNHLASLGSRSEQKYFAQSFPTGVTIGGQDAKTILLNLTR